MMKLTVALRNRLPNAHKTAHFEVDDLYSNALRTAVLQHTT
jgi:Flp pilus assembly CpaF family ATPase